MRTLKVLPVRVLSRWYDEEPDYVAEEGHFKEIPPVYNRPGWYYDPNTSACWFELSNGKAYDNSHNSGYFKWVLKAEDAKYSRLRKCEVDALLVLRKNRILTGHLATRLWWELTVKKYRRTYVDARLNMMRWDKEDRVKHPEDYNE